MHVYVTGSGGAALPPHTDTTDVLVAQLRGSGRVAGLRAVPKDKAPFASTACPSAEAGGGTRQPRLLAVRAGARRRAGANLRSTCRAGDGGPLPKESPTQPSRPTTAPTSTVGLKRVTWHRVLRVSGPSLLFAESGMGEPASLLRARRGEKAAPAGARASQARMALKTLESAGDAAPRSRATHRFSTWLPLRRRPGGARPRLVPAARDTLCEGPRRSPGRRRVLSQSCRHTSLSMPCEPCLSPRSLWARSPRARRGACDEQAFVAGAARRPPQTATRTLGGHAPSAMANTLTLATADKGPFTWEDNRRRLGVCQRGRLLPRRMGGERGGDILAGEDRGHHSTDGHRAQTRYYGCSVGSHRRSCDPM